MKLTIVDAIREALKSEMAKDETIIIIGEDIGKNGGVFRATDELQHQFGDQRVIDTPLSEIGLVGSAIGMAAHGLKPIVEIQFMGFIYNCFDQIISHAARLRTRTRGKLTCPLVIRAPYSGGIHAPEHHSESMEAIFTHTPGIKVVIPSTPTDAKGLLTAAIRDPDPVIFLEPKRIYRAIKEEVPDEAYETPLGKARVVTEGTEITIIAWGAMVREAVMAANMHEGKIEVIDVRTLFPLDEDTIINSVKKTGRAIIVAEAPRTCGFAADIIACINDKAFTHIKAPVKRVTGFDTIFPLAKLEKLYLPDAKKIDMAVEKLLMY